VSEIKVSFVSTVAYNTSTRTLVGVFRIHVILVNVIYGNDHSRTRIQERQQSRRY
jgi:hypothetical protein